MAETIFLVRILAVLIAALATPAFSSNSWYCHRLVSQFITSYVTPCTFPCLVVSRHEGPKIIVQREPDGTTCRIPQGFRQERKIGKCRSSVCRPAEPFTVLKRKRRFICLIALAHLLKMRNQRDALQNRIRRLSEELRRSGLNTDDKGSLTSDLGRAGAGATGFRVGNTGGTLGGRSDLESMGVRSSLISNFAAPASGNGASRISGADGLSSRAGNNFEPGITGNVIGGPASSETSDVSGTNGAATPIRVSGDMYSRNINNPLDILGSAAGGTDGIGAAAGRVSGPTEGYLVGVTGARGTPDV